MINAHGISNKMGNGSYQSDEVDGVCVDYELQVSSLTLITDSNIDVNSYSQNLNQNHYPLIENPDIHTNPGNIKLDESARWLSQVVSTQRGRDAFILELNQFRSKNVELGEGFPALGAVLWDLLDHCREDNDVHSAKVIMMLSQTFYRKNLLPSVLRSKETENSDNPPSSVGAEYNHTGEGSDIFDDDRLRDRAADKREYLKEMLISHSIWRDESFWEQALWQCALEQLQSIPYEKKWHDLDDESRLEAVRRIHSVIFSQVMAIIHSMMELGCSKEQTREFLYRMCVIHQLSERQRHNLLSHLLSR